MIKKSLLVAAAYGLGVFLFTSPVQADVVVSSETGLSLATANSQINAHNSNMFIKISAHQESAHQERAHQERKKREKERKDKREKERRDKREKREKERR